MVTEPEKDHRVCKKNVKFISLTINQRDSFIHNGVSFWNGTRQWMKSTIKIGDQSHLPMKQRHEPHS